jgi:hypothetical protein
MVAAYFDGQILSGQVSFDELMGLRPKRRRTMSQSSRRSAQSVEKSAAGDAGVRRENSVN